MILKRAWVFLIILCCFASVKAWTFKSTIEAYTLFKNSPGICLGNCIQDKCTYDWHAHETQCRQSSIPTKKYRTLDNELCTSNCGNYDDESYQWCAIGTNYWGYCSRLIALKGTVSYRTNNEYVSCSDQCLTRGYSYFWCNTVVGWQKCDPEKKILVFDYRTKDYKECKTPCEIYKTDDLPHCYDASGTWARCYLNPAYENTIDDINQNLRSHCKPGGFFEEGYRLCRRQTSKRAINELDFTCTLDVDDVARRHAENNPTVEVRSWTSLIPITTDSNPITSYTVFPTTRDFGEDQINLPLVVRAVITSHTLLPVGAPRQAFTSEVTRYYRAMDIITGRDNNDERGHIVASRLGGPMEAYNIFPQSWRHNRGRGSKWFRMEASLDTFLRGHDNRHAEYTAILSYSTDLNNNLEHRPTAIALRIRLYIAGALSDIDGNPLASYRDNPYENMYFSNDPDEPCD